MKARDLLRDVAEEALEKRQDGLVIWSNWSEWDEWLDDLGCSQKEYLETLQRVTRNEKFSYFSTPEFIIISTKKLMESDVESDKLFENIIKTWESNSYNGPITFIPSNQLSDFC